MDKYNWTMELNPKGIFYLDMNNEHNNFFKLKPNKYVYIGKI